LVQVIENVDCDNAPKKRVLRDLAVALAEGDPDGIVVELAAMSSGMWLVSTRFMA
jgi:hypothetical protein